MQYVTNDEKLFLNIKMIVFYLCVSATFYCHMVQTQDSCVGINAVFVI